MPSGDRPEGELRGLPDGSTSRTGRDDPGVVAEVSPPGSHRLREDPSSTRTRRRRRRRRIEPPRHGTDPDVAEFGDRFPDDPRKDPRREQAEGRCRPRRSDEGRDRRHPRSRSELPGHRQRRDGKSRRRRPDPPRDGSVRRDELRGSSGDPRSLPSVILLRCIDEPGGTVPEAGRVRQGLPRRLRTDRTSASGRPRVQLRWILQRRPRSSLQVPSPVPQPGPSRSPRRPRGSQRHEEPERRAPSPRRAGTPVPQ
mmetsp:Transcript_22007/g.52368  ORF Transcript_22007/g.52368 Transcript_22007/m.52368 type:complete len:254 (-) Transcript_22007:852-1613(-)